jgi:hypothetical protein
VQGHPLLRHRTRPQVARQTRCGVLVKGPGQRRAEHGPRRPGRLAIDREDANFLKLERFAARDPQPGQAGRQASGSKEMQSRWDRDDWFAADVPAGPLSKHLGPPQEPAQHQVAGVVPRLEKHAQLRTAIVDVAQRRGAPLGPEQIHAAVHHLPGGNPVIEDVFHPRLPDDCLWPWTPE